MLDESDAMEGMTKDRDSSPASDNTTRTADKKKMASYKRGGKVGRTGPAMLHKGEVVVPAKKARGQESIERFIKRRNKKEGK